MGFRSRRMWAAYERSFIYSRLIDPFSMVSWCCTKHFSPVFNHKHYLFDEFQFVWEIYTLSYAHRMCHIESNLHLHSTILHTFRMLGLMRERKKTHTHTHSQQHLITAQMCRSIEKLLQIFELGHRYSLRWRC